MVQVCSSEFRMTEAPCVVILNKYDELMSPISKEISYETKLRVIHASNIGPVKGQTCSIVYFVY